MKLMAAPPVVLVAIGLCAMCVHGGVTLMPDSSMPPVNNESLAKNLPQNASCGSMADRSRKKRWTRLGNTLWGEKDMPLTISVGRVPRTVSTDTVKRIAMKCAEMWAGPTKLLSFKLAPRGETRGNIAMNFEYIDGPWGTVGLGLSPTPFHNPPSSYLKLDSAETWRDSKDSPGQGISLTWAICHEMGHNLGLSHSNDKKAIMYPSGIGQDENSLPWDDTVGITTLYGRGNRQTNSRNTPRTPTTVRNRPRPTPYTTRYTRPRTRATRRPTQHWTYGPTRNPYMPRTPPPGHIPNYRPTPPTVRYPRPNNRVTRPVTHHWTPWSTRRPSRRGTPPPGYVRRYRPTGRRASQTNTRTSRPSRSRKSTRNTNNYNWSWYN